MLEKDHIKLVALFFYYTVVDENLAKTATIDTVRRLKKQQTSNSPVVAESQIVREANKTMVKFKKSKHFHGTGPGIFFDWISKASGDLGLWRELQKVGRYEEVLALTWSKILKFSDEQIAEGLDISVGTLRHRISRGLQTLGSINRP